MGIAKMFKKKTKPIRTVKVSRKCPLCGGDVVVDYYDPQADTRKKEPPSKEKRVHEELIDAHCSKCDWKMFDDLEETTSYDISGLKVFLIMPSKTKLTPQFMYETMILGYPLGIYQKKSGVSMFTTLGDENHIPMTRYRNVVERLLRSYWNERAEAIERYLVNECDAMSVTWADKVIRGSEPDGYSDEAKIVEAMGKADVYVSTPDFAAIYGVDPLTTLEMMVAAYHGYKFAVNVQRVIPVEKKVDIRNPMRCLEHGMDLTDILNEAKRNCLDSGVFDEYPELKNWAESDDVDVDIDNMEMEV